MLQEGRLEAAVSQEYNIVTKDGAVYLECIDSTTKPTNMSTMEAAVTDSLVRMSTNSRTRRSIVFFGETGAGKSSAINLLLGTGTHAPVSNDGHPCTRATASYKTTLGDTTYNLWDSRGLGDSRGFFQTFLGESSEKELKKFLKERHASHEIDLLVLCVRGSRASKALLRYYNEFCVITRRLAAPVVIVVTHLEKEKNMEDWWSRNSADLKKLEMEFDDHICITTLPEHHRRAESRKKLVDLVTKDRRWEAKESGFYFGSPVQKSTLLAPARKTRIWSRRKAIGRAKSDDEDLSLCSSSHSGPSSRAPSTTGSSYHTAGSLAESMPPSPVTEPPTPRSATILVKVPHINAKLLRASDRPQPPSEDTSSSTGESLSSMFHSSSHSSYTSYSEIYLESCKEENENCFGELPFRPSTSTVRRRKSLASRNGVFGDVWECDLISGKSSRMVAVRAMKTNIDGHEEKKFQRELKIWGKLQHRNIVPLLGVVSGFGPLPSTVSPWFRNWSLSWYLAKNQVSGSQKHRLLWDIAVGLRYLHSQGVIHGDLHSGNILIDDDGTACITDFGLSFIRDFLGTPYLKSGICGGVHFADPALVQRAYRSQDNMFYPTEPCDIYSFGGLMLHILSGKKPYDGISSQKVFVTVLDGERPQIPNKGMTQWHKKLILRCWDHDESTRPSADGLVRMFDRQ
ncbi:kinase-like domain-containing protein [Boletus edulis BED1]|uniref:Kinase-like domain-containing protein n=1 Tax=Boletus edulis BED1 TaxID=1328754 RepID=A0AAD4BW40_BOLED|nr:kinase-like domain-containing protein [Boletus edulis BED1]